MREGLGSFLFLWWVNSRASNSFGSSWVVGMLNDVRQRSLWILNLSHCTSITDMLLRSRAVSLIFASRAFAAVLGRDAVADPFANTCR